jgi:hypothetical protein
MENLPEASGENDTLYHDVNPLIARRKCNPAVNRF